MRLIPHLLLMPLAVASIQVVSAQDTAYQALRTLGSSRDQALLNRVVEVKGRNGAPQPDTWLIVIDDPKARGGVREVEVSGGRIASERTPVQAYSGASGATMDMSRLNLDSQGAFTVAEEEARAAGISFDSVDYVLRPNDDGSAPLWVLQLLDPNNRGVGTVRIAADNGDVVSRQFSSSRPIASERQSSPRSQAPPAPPAPRETRSARQSTPPPAYYDEPMESIGPNEPTYAPPPRTSSQSRTSRSRSSGSSYTTGNAPRSATGGNNRAPGRTTYREHTDAVRGQEADNRPGIEEVGRDLGHRINRRAHRIGGALQKFFTGKRTVDEKYREPYDNP